MVCSPLTVLISYEVGVCGAESLSANYLKCCCVFG